MKYLFVLFLFFLSLPRFEKDFESTVKSIMKAQEVKALDVPDRLKRGSIDDHGGCPDGGGSC